MPTIRGNHERQISDQPRERMGLSDRHASDHPSAEQLAWLAALPTTMRPSKDVLLVHGTPGNDLAYFLETVTEEGLREATREEVEHRAGTIDAALILCGHTHLQRVMTLDDGRMIINPGSVGLPAYDGDRPHAHRVESGSPHARYAVLSNEVGGWAVELLFVVYDWEQAVRDAEAHARTDWSRALRTGRVEHGSIALSDRNAFREAVSILKMRTDLRNVTCRRAGKNSWGMSPASTWMKN